MRKLNNSTTERACSKCKELKPLSTDNFHSEKGRYLGFSYVCKACEKVRGRKKYLKNPRPYRYDLMTVEQKMAKLICAGKYRKTPKGKAIFYFKAYQNIDKKKGLITDVDQAYLLESFKQPCCYCGYPSVGVDRKDNSKGHTKENCVPCCKECNVGRMDNFTHEEMFFIGQAIKQVKDNRNKEKLKIAL